MYVIVMHSPENRQDDLYYVSSSVMTLSVPEIRRRFPGEEVTRPTLFASREEANRCVNEWTGCVVTHAPSWVFPDPTELTLDLTMKLLDVLIRSLR